MHCVPPPKKNPGRSPRSACNPLNRKIVVQMSKEYHMSGIVALQQILLQQGPSPGTAGHFPAERSLRAYPFARADRMANRASRASKCTGASGQFTGKAALESRPVIVSNRLLRSTLQSRFTYTSLMKPGWLQRSRIPCSSRMTSSFDALDLLSLRYPI